MRCLAPYIDYSSGSICQLSAIRAEELSIRQAECRPSSSVSFKAESGDAEPVVNFPRDLSSPMSPSKKKRFKKKSRSSSAGEEGPHSKTWRDREGEAGLDSNQPWAKSATIRVEAVAGTTSFGLREADEQAVDCWLWKMKSKFGLSHHYDLLLQELQTLPGTTSSSSLRGHSLWSLLTRQQQTVSCIAPTTSICPIYVSFQQPCSVFNRAYPFLIASRLAA